MRQKHEAVRRKRLLAAITGVISTALALLAIFAALSDPEPLTMVLAVAAALAGLLLWPIHWHGAGRSFRVTLAVGGAMAIAAALVEWIDGPPPLVSRWRAEHAPVKIYEIPTGDRPRAIAAQGRDVWVVGLNAARTKGLLWRIDSKNLGPAAEELPAFRAVNPYDIATDKEAVWVTDGANLIKLNLRGDELWRRAFGDGGENEVDTGLEKVWFKDTSTGKIFAINPASGKLLRGPIDVGPEAAAIAVGLGSVWVSSSDAQGSPVVARLNPRGTVMGKISVQANPEDLAAGHHYVYVNHSNDGLIGRIDPDRGAFGEEVPGGRQLSGTGPFGGIATGGRAVWAPFAGSNNVFAVAECNYKSIGHTHSGDYPSDVAVLRGKAYVPNFKDGNVAVLRLRQSVCTHSPHAEHQPLRLRRRLQPSEHESIEVEEAFP